MAKAAGFFYDANDSGRQTLHRRITPSDSQFEEQQARWNALADFLVGQLRDRTGYPIRTWLQGSYKFATQIRPVRMTEEFDIDLGVYYCWNGDRNDGNLTPKELKKHVQDSLGSFAKANDDVVEVVEPAKERCCRVRFRGSFHIDIPAYHLEEERAHRSLATEQNIWEDSDPKAIYVWFKDQFEEDLRARVRRLVRYLKAWAALKFADTGTRPSSLLLTVLVAETIQQLLKEGPLPREDDEALEAVLHKMSTNLGINRNVRNPVDQAENLATRMQDCDWRIFLEKLKSFSDTASAAILDQERLSACARWETEFEHLFPLPDVKELNDRVKNLPPVVTHPEVRVTAVSQENSSLTYAGVNGIGPIPKKCKIAFEVSNASNMPYGTQFYWMVRNEGDEAEDVNDLGHKAGIGLRAEERSTYKGNHFMDCKAVLNGRVIGVRRILVKIIGMSVPQRKSNRAALLKLLGRR